MKAEKKMFVAFILNLVFSVFEFIGGIFTGSVAIISDAVHDLGDAASIGVAFFLEKKSKKQPDEKYTYGYSRYSVVGSLFTTLILLLGSILVVYNAVLRMITPNEVYYDGMIIFAVIGISVNLAAAILTRNGDSLNQKAVNLHVLEDVLGWIVVLVGAIIMRFTNFYILDPLMSIGVAIFIFVNALKALKETLDVFLEKTPKGISLNEIQAHLCEIDGIVSVHHVHVWSMDGNNRYATMHIVAKEKTRDIKDKIRKELKEHGIGHVTLELESETETCNEEFCRVDVISTCGHHHGHHH